MSMILSNLDFNSIPSGIPLSEERVDYLSNRATETTTAFKRKIEKLSATVAEARDKYNKEANDIVGSAAPGRNTARSVAEHRAARSFASHHAATKVVNIHRELIASSESERAAMLKGLKALADEAEAIQSVFQSPSAMLGRFALGDQKRTQYQLQLAEAGPLELTTAARTAIMTNDLILAAAVMAVVDRLPKDRRPFAARDFAERLMGDVWARLNNKLKGVQLAFNTAMVANREFVRGKADHIANVGIALAQKAIDEALAEEG
jgi:hypothetical protein